MPDSCEAVPLVEELIVPLASASFAAERHLTTPADIARVPLVHSLRCVVPWNPAERPRCQAICQTGGPWCQGPHWCASLGQDVSGLAGTDSVCGWVGE